jgi:TPR repeat protein
MEQGALNEVLARHRRDGEPLPWEPRDRNYALHIANGLAYLHGQKVVHRDLKSPNVFIGRGDVAVLADFEFAKTVESTSLQVATAQVGTVDWMAPGMISSGTYTAASDVYACGIILWELCACKVPYEEFVSVHQLAAAVAQELEQAKKLRALGRVAEARPLLQVAVDGGNVEAMFELGCSLECGGWGFNIDLRRASEIMWLASEGGYGPAMAKLAVMFKDRTGVGQDIKKVEEWGVKALQTEDAYACGLCYNFGLGVIKDLSKAVEWYTRAAEQGNVYAQNNLGMCYYNGEGAVKNENKALEWYTRAPKQGYANAQLNLGICHTNGHGVAKGDKRPRSCT